MDKRNELQIYSPPNWIKGWEEYQGNENREDTLAVTALSAFVGAVGGAIACIWTTNWTFISTSILVSLPSLVLLGGLFMTGATKYYQHKHKDELRHKDLSDIQRVTLSRYGQQSDEDKRMVLPIVKSMLMTDVDEDQRVLKDQFNKVLRSLETQKALLRKLAPNPALDEAKRICEHVEAMNKELTDQLNGVDKRYSD